MKLGLKEFRESHAMSQREVAALPGVSSNYYAALERGQNPVSMEFIERLADHYGVSAIDLMDDQTTSGHANSLLARLQAQSEGGVIAPNLVALLDIASKLDEAGLFKTLNFVRFKAAQRQ